MTCNLSCETMSGFERLRNLNQDVQWVVCVMDEYNEAKTKMGVDGIRGVGL